jgi:hypothetical protein
LHLDVGVKDDDVAQAIAVAIRAGGFKNGQRPRQIVSGIRHFSWNNSPSLPFCSVYSRLSIANQTLKILRRARLTIA